MNRGTASKPEGIWLALSEREKQIVECAREGLIDKEIAKKLEIGMGTVRTYWERIRSKTGARSRAELISLISLEDMSALLNEAQQTQAVLASILDNALFGLALYANDTGEVLHVNKLFHETCILLSSTLFKGLPEPKNSDLDATCINKFLELEDGQHRFTIGPKGCRYRVASAHFKIGDRPVSLVNLDEVTIPDELKSADLEKLAE